MGVFRPHISVCLCPLVCFLSLFALLSGFFSLCRFEYVKKPKNVPAQPLENNSMKIVFFGMMRGVCILGVFRAHLDV